jgi:hypothetical protein
MPLIDVRRPIRPDIRANMTAARTDHAAAQRPHRHIISQPIAVHARAVMASVGIAIDEQIPTAMAANVTHGYGRE